MKRPYRIHWQNKETGKTGIFPRRCYQTLIAAETAIKQIEQSFSGGFGDFHFSVTVDQRSVIREYVDKEFYVYDENGHYKNIASSTMQALKFLELYADKVNVVMPRSVLIGMLKEILEQK